MSFKLNKQGKIRLVPIILTIILIYLLRTYLEGLYNPTTHKGPWYAVTIPKGWEKKIVEDEVVFISPEKDILTDLPEAIFSIYTQKHDGALFIEDLFYEVLNAIKESGNIILKKGAIKIDTQISRWVLYQDNELELIILSFFIVDDFNRFTKIQFVTKIDKFNVYRSTFEEFKDSLKYRKMF